ncbi:MAG: GFA family protein [Myxococcota bacterium]
MIRGSCLCGDVTWEYSGTPQFIGTCHCSMCRKTHGAASATVLGGTPDGLRVLAGEDGITTYLSSKGVKRPFCSRCGSPVPGEPEEGQSMMMMPAGCLDDDPGIRLSAHIFVASKAPWHEITGQAPRFDAYPPGVGGAVVERTRSTEPREGAVRGSCLCGDLAYEIEGDLPLFLNCHCSRCRKARGTEYASLLLIEAKQFRWLRGQEGLESYKVPGALRFKHCFCRVCGSSLPEVHPQQVVVPAGTLDDDPGTRPGCHIFTGSKASWFEITDELPQYEEYPTAP